VRVIFDRSAFHGDNFAALANSPLRKLAIAKRVMVFHTPVFLDETIMSFGSKNASEEWKAHLAFAVDVCNGGLFLSKMEIWRNELVRGEGPRARHLYPGKPNKNHNSMPRLLARLRRASESGDLEKEWLDSQAERDDAHEKRSNQKELFSGARSAVAEALKSRTVKGRLKDYRFSEFRKEMFIPQGKLLMSLVDDHRHGALAYQWAQSPSRFPYYSAFVEGFVYSEYYAAVEHNLPIDRNAQADFEQLAYLNWADVVVSNDEGFFRAAFEALWKPRGKRMESAQSFAALLAAVDTR
jgi:hypothetical protein